MNEIYNSKNELNFWNNALSSGQKFVSENRNFLIEHRNHIAIIVVVALAIFLTYNFVKSIYRSFYGRVNPAPNHAHPQTEIKPEDFIISDCQKYEEKISFLSSQAMKEHTIEERNICMQLRILDDSIECFEELDFFDKWGIQKKDFDSLHAEINDYKCHGGENVLTFNYDPPRSITCEEKQVGEKVLIFCRSAKKVLSDLQIKYEELSKENMSLSLPNDLQRHIFRYCSTKTIRILSSVSKRINRLANADLGKIIVRQGDRCVPNHPFPLKGQIIIRANLYDDELEIQHIRQILQAHNQRPAFFINDASIVHRKLYGENVNLKTLYDEKCQNESNPKKTIFLDLIYRTYSAGPDLYLPSHPCERDFRN